MPTLELKYGQLRTYKHSLDNERLNWLTSKTNRSNGQTLFLFQLVDGDFDKLKQLEMNIKNCFFNGSPADKETAERVLSMNPRTEWFSL